jgi:hypothetical protein
MTLKAIAIHPPSDLSYSRGSKAIMEGIKLLAEFSGIEFFDSLAPAVRSLTASEDAERRVWVVGPSKSDEEVMRSLVASEGQIHAVSFSELLRGFTVSPLPEIERGGPDDR